MNWRSWKPWAVVVLLVGVCLPGCKRQQAAPPPPPPEVAVVTVQPQPIVLTSELPGRTAAYLVAEIRPQVNGLIQKRLFTEGAQVKKGDVLYEIDPAPYKAAFENASATLASAKEAAERARTALTASIAALKRHQAILKLAITNRDRFEKLLKTSAASAMERDQAVADVDVADAGLKVAEAQVASDRQSVRVAEAAIKQAEAAKEMAQINLDYTKITAPITGRIGRSNITVGAIATAYQPTPLAMIQQFDPIYVDVPQSTVELHRLRRNLANGRLKDKGTDRVRIVLQDGTVYGHEGSLKFRDVTVDPTTGSVILRIEVPNPEGTLLPNMFIQAVIEEGVRDEAMLVPQQAVSRDPKGNPLAMVVVKGKVVVKDKDGAEREEEAEIVQSRPVTTERAIGDKWLVSSGLKPGDRVVVDGMQRASQRMREKLPVKAVPFAAEGTAAATKPEGTAQKTAPLNRQ